MKNIKVTTLAITMLLGACTYPFQPQETQEAVRFRYANEETQISLQEPYTRVIVKCYSTRYEPAETCAKLFENRGYVRFRDIPYKTATYDLKSPRKYPTRRWRSGEITSRW